MLGLRQAAKDQDDAKPPRRQSTPILFAYIAVFGIFLPGLFMGLGNFIICPFCIPNGWNMSGSDARSSCDQLGAQKAATIYTLISIVYGIFIGYASNHLIRRWILSVKNHVETRKRIKDIGKKAETNRKAEAERAAQSIKMQTLYEKNKEQAEKLEEEMKRLRKERDAIEGIESHSHRRSHGSNSSRHPRKDRSVDSRDYHTVSSMPITSGGPPPLRPNSAFSQNVRAPQPAYQRGPPHGPPHGPPAGPPAGPPGAQYNGPPSGQSNGPRHAPSGPPQPPF